MEGPSKLTIYLILSGLPEFCLHLSLLSTRILVNFIQFSQYSSSIWMKESNSRVFLLLLFCFQARTRSTNVSLKECRLGKLVFVISKTFYLFYARLL